MYFRIRGKLRLDWNADDKFTALLSENILSVGEEEGHFKVVTLRFCLTDCSKIQTPAPDLQESTTGGGEGLGFIFQPFPFYLNCISHFHGPHLRLDCLKLTAESGLWDDVFFRNGKKKKRKEKRNLKLKSITVMWVTHSLMQTQWIHMF